MWTLSRRCLRGVCTILPRQYRKPIAANVVIGCSLTASHVNALLDEALTCGEDGVIEVDDQLSVSFYQGMVISKLEIRDLSRHVLRMTCGVIVDRIGLKLPELGVG